MVEEERLKFYSLNLHTKTVIKTPTQPGSDCAVCELSGRVDGALGQRLCAVLIRSTDKSLRLLVNKRRRRRVARLATDSTTAHARLVT